MRTQKHYINRKGEYSYTITLEFEDLERLSDLKEPVEGVVKIDVSDEFPYPINISLKDEMEQGNNKPAVYVEFESTHREVDKPSKSPIEFQFTTIASTPSTIGGSKCISFKTAEYDPDTNLDPKENPEFIEHHVGLPSSQRIKLAHQILRGDGCEKTIQEIMTLYGDYNRTSAADEFYKKVENDVSFTQRVRIQNFLIGKTGMKRTQPQTVNKLKKQLTDEDNRHRTQSPDDVKNLIRLIENQDNFPNVGLEEVLEKVKKESNENQLGEITNRLGVDELCVSSFE